MEETNSYVYRHRKLDSSEVFYIGIGTFESHIPSNSHNYYRRANNTKQRSSFWKKVYRKYGRYIEILKENISYEEAKELEILLIQEYGRRDLGTGCLVNLTDGGDGSINKIPLKGKDHPNYGKKASKETRLKQSKSRKEWLKNNKHLIKGMPSESNPMYGKKHKEETLKKMKEIKLGKNNPMYGKTLSEEAKNKQRDKKTGKNNPMYGVNKGDAPSAKKLIDIVTGETYDCIKCASEELGIKYQTLQKYLRGELTNKTNLRYYNEE